MKKLHVLSMALGLSVAGLSFAGGPDQPTTSNGGFYAGGGGGVAFFTSDRAHGSNTGFDLNAHAGYKINNFRLEGSFDYLRQNESASIGSATLNQYSFMANGYYDINLGSAFVPFVGFGLGVTHFSGNVNVNTPLYTVYGSGTDNEFTYQAIAGLGYKITNNLVANVSYHFWGFSNANFHQHVILGGLDYHFA